MVQDHDSMPSIPEELYNLTQLAEVTLAAGKLSTTNISEITEYIKSEKIKKEDEFDDLSLISIEKSQNKGAKKFKYQQKLQYDKNFNETTKENLINKYKINDTNNNFPIVKPIPIIANLPSTKTVGNIMKNFENVNFFSSSDDDSNYYSHKIFDRKKSRRSTFSDNSTIRFDELSCSSIPSSCDELNFSASGRNVGGGGDGGGGVVGGGGGGSSSGNVTSGSNSCGENSLKLIRENSNSSLDDEHICPECGKKYSTSSNLARHRQTHRSILDKKARRCPYCEKVYVSMPAYSMHVRTHNQGCKCDHCGKCFSRPWLLQGHIRTHTGEKPFKCSTCNKAFADKSNLRAHIQTHSNTKPHACGRCGKSFALKSYLYKHEESSCMRNHLKNEKDRVTSVKSLTPLSSSKMSATKSTLASKILQKESQHLKEQQLNRPFTPQQFPESLTSGKKLSWDSDRNDLKLSSDNDNLNNENRDEKSYTTLTSQMSQEEYDHFARISVIRPPISTNQIPSINNQNYADHFILNQPTNGIQMNFYQENPVDFSPKNNFTHSTKTSPFELTNSYTMVA